MNSPSSRLTFSSNSTRNGPLQELLGIVLMLGNTLNSGNFHGGAAGFTMENLTNLDGVKSADGSVSLLDFLVTTVDEKSPELLKFLDELAELRGSNMKNVSMKTIQVPDPRGLWGATESTTRSTRSITASGTA